MIMPKIGKNIYKRKDGRWEGRYIKDRDDSGKIIYGSVYGKTCSEVKLRLSSYGTEKPTFATNHAVTNKNSITFAEIAIKSVPFLPLAYVRNPCQGKFPFFIPPVI